jgi:aldose 1-epimerase
VIRIADGALSAVIVPEIGAGLARFDIQRDGEIVPVFRPCLEPDPEKPFDLASFLMVPWSNRVSGGGFRFEGRFHPLAPNVPGQEFPLHGNGFGLPWRVITGDERGVTLELVSDGPGPFLFRAVATYTLRDGAMRATLGVENRAAIRLPHGLGFHPWFARTPRTTLWSPATTVILENERKLPGARVPLRDLRDWDFGTPRPLPDTRVNCAFDGWSGEARIDWPERGLALEIAAEGPCRAYIVWSPGADADFLCHEPVTHLVDAFNEPGGAEANGLRMLATGESLEIACVWRPILT